MIINDEHDENVTRLQFGKHEDDENDGIDDNA